MATRVPAHRSIPPLWRIGGLDDPHRLHPEDPYAEELLDRATRIREQIRAEDDESGWGWAA